MFSTPNDAWKQAVPFGVAEKQMLNFLLFFSEFGMSSTWLDIQLWLHHGNYFALFLVYFSASLDTYIHAYTYVVAETSREIEAREMEV